MPERKNYLDLALVLVGAPMGVVMGLWTYFYSRWIGANIPIPNWDLLFFIINIIVVGEAIAIFWFMIRRGLKWFQWTIFITSFLLGGVGVWLIFK